MTKPTGHVAADFDAIAAALREAPGSRRLTAAERAVLHAIPPHARRGLDVGCGDGALTRAAAARGLQMLAIDLAPGMIALAQARSAARLGVEYRVADVMTIPLVPGSFDAVISVNMVHHLPLSTILPRLAELVAPGGRLIIQDVVTRTGLRHFPINAVAALWSRSRRFARHEPLARTVQRLYDMHGAGETYLEPQEVEPSLSPLLPGVVVTHHLEWRYTAIWNRARGS